MNKLLIALLSAGVLLAACSKDKDVDPPAVLVDIDHPKLKIDRLWKDGLGGKAVRLRLALRPQILDGVAYAASHDGDVVALAEDNGHRKWRTKTKLPLSAGPGVGEGVVVVGSSHGEVVALDAATGAQRWKRTVSSEVLAVPLVTGEVAVIRMVDGRLQALSLADGQDKWTVEQAMPKLSLRGTASPVRAGDAIIAGFDNGRVMSVDVNSGTTLWDTLVSAPHGRTELERLSDIDAPAKVSGQDVFVVGFQGRAAMLALESGQIWWARDLSSYRGFSVDDDNIYVTNSDSIVQCLRRRDGAVLWEYAGLRRRGLTAPAIDGENLVVADFEGYVHWLDKTTGDVIARAKTDGERVTNTPVAADGRVFVMTDAGAVVAFRSQPKAGSVPRKDSTAPG
jgi:outer membrane protein assembly factor BamB